jgi:preprotein translocase subunit Sss1
LAGELHEIMRALGRLEEGQERQRADFDAEKAASSESRGRMHSKLEKIEEDVSIVGKVAAQARDKVDLLEVVVNQDVKPATDEFKRMRAIGITGITLIGFAFTALGVTIASFGDQVVTTLRHFLRIT